MKELKKELEWEGKVLKVDGMKMMRGFYFSLQVQEKKKLLASLSFTQFLHLLSLEARNKVG